MIRRFAILGGLLVACSVLVMVAFTGGAAAADHEIDSCTVIDEPGAYELVDDVQTDEEATCIEIRAANVTLDGNDHTVTGPGAANEDGVEWAGIAIDQNGEEPSEVTIRDLQVEAFENGLYAQSGGPLVLEDAVLRDNDRGAEVFDFREVTFRNTTLADNDGPGYYGDTHGDATFTNVTVEGNGRDGIVTYQIFDLEVTSSTLRDNGGFGLETSETSSVEVASTTIRDNGGGVSINFPGFASLTNVTLTGNQGMGIRGVSGGPISVTDSEVTANGATGIRIDDSGDATNEVSDSLIADNGGHGVQSYERLLLTDVTLEDNAGNELESYEEFREGNVTAENLEVGPSATTAFERQAINLDSVDREALPARDDGTAVGDGLNVTGNVSGPIDLELDVDTDDDPVDLWRHDGSEWETVEEDLPVENGAIQASIDREGVYAPGTDGDQQDDDSGDDPSDEDGSKEKTHTPTPSDEDGEKKAKTDEKTEKNGEKTEKNGEKTEKNGETATPTSTPADEDGETKDEKTETERGNDATEAAETKKTKKTKETTAKTPGTNGETETEAGDTPNGQATETQGSDHQQVDDDPATRTDEAAGAAGDAAEAAGDDDVESPVPADGPGFTPVAALVALLVAAFLTRRPD